MKNLRSIVSAMALTCLAFVSTAQKAADYAGEYTMSDNPYVKVLKLADKEGKLIMSAEVPPDQLYTEGQVVDEFARTVSRLIEMQSRDYIESPRRIINAHLT